MGDWKLSQYFQSRSQITRSWILDTERRGMEKNKSYAKFSGDAFNKRARNTYMGG